MGDGVTFHIDKAGRKLGRKPLFFRCRCQHAIAAQQASHKNLTNAITECRQHPGAPEEVCREASPLPIDDLRCHHDRSGTKPGIEPSGAAETDQGSATLGKQRRRR